MVQLGDTAFSEGATSGELPSADPRSEEVIAQDPATKNPTDRNAAEGRAAPGSASPAGAPTSETVAMEPAPPTGASLVGKTLGGRYRVTSMIGAGGMGAVYRAEHMQLQKPVALKVLNAEMAAHREASLRFEREALVSARIVHPHVVSATDSGRLPDGSLYLVLEFVQGRTLRDLIDVEKPLPPARALAIAGQIADALAAAHAAEIVHRDLKPGNVMLLSHDGNPEFVKVLDFGLARVVGQASASQQLTRSGSVFGTPEYMSPEQARGEVVDHRADLYALGVILYELLAGHPPFRAPELLAVLLKHLQEQPPPLPADIPRPLAEYVMKLLDKQPERRPADARQVVKALRRLSPARPVFSSAPPARSSEAPLHIESPSGALRRAAHSLRELGSWIWLFQKPLARRSGIHLREFWAALDYGLYRLGRRLGLMKPRAPFSGMPPPAELLNGHRRGPGFFEGHPARRIAVLATLVVTLLGVVLLIWPRRIDSSDLQQRASQGEAKAMHEIAAVPPLERPGAASLALATGYVSSGQLEQALGAFSAALDADPRLKDNKDLLNGVRRAADDPALRDRALELAATRLGASGADLLFDAWTAKGTKAVVMRSIRKWLDKDSVRASASPALTLALALRETHGCGPLKELLVKVRAQGDERCVTPLKRMQARSGCGFLNLEDCYGCLRGEGGVEQALAAVTDRTAPHFETRAADAASGTGASASGSSTNAASSARSGMAGAGNNPR
jgi:serine/threonine protein kinase